MGRFQLLLCVVCSTLVTTLGCQSQSETPEDRAPQTPVDQSNAPLVPNEDLQSQLGTRLKQLWAENSDTVMLQVEKYLELNDSDLDELEERAKELGEEGLRRWADYQPELEEKKKVLIAKVQELKDAGPAKWLEMKDGLDQAWSDFKGSMDRAKKALDIP
jgi:hypothetical protein